MQSCIRGDVINKENADSIWTCLSRGGNGSLFMDFRDPISSSCQQRDPCRVLLKFEILINLSTFNSNQFLFVNCNNSDSCILCDDHLLSNGLGIQDATFWACYNKITQGTT